MRDLSELHINESGEPVSRPSPSHEIVSAFEAQVGHTLPHDYLELLRLHNGGHPELDSIQPIGRPGGARWTVNRFYHLDDNKNSPASIWTASARWRGTLGKDAIPFAADPGGNQFFLDMTTQPASVKICVHDECFSIVEIAPSFAAFIDGLSIDPDMI